MNQISKAVISHILLPLMILGMLTASSHKFYVSISQVDLNRDTRSLEISMRVFTHDLIDAIKGDKEDLLLLGSDKENPEAADIIVKYLNDNFAILQGKHNLDFNFIGFELENDIIWMYLEVPFKKFSDFQIENKLIMDLYPDQKNIVNFRDSGSTKSQICTKSKPAHSFKIHKRVKKS